MRDGRRAPFCWQSHSALEAIRERCHADNADEKVSTAVAVYVALTLEASRNHREGGREHLEASRARIADIAGVSVRTLDRYSAMLAELGLVAVERRRNRDLHLPNVWTLIEPDRGGATTAPPGATTTPRVAQPLRRGGATTAHLVQEEQQEDTRAPCAPRGKRARDHASFGQDITTWIAHALPHLADQPPAVEAVRQAIVHGKARTPADVESFLAQWWPRLSAPKEEAA